MENWVLTWWFGAIHVIGGGILAIALLRVKNIFIAATFGFVILLIQKALFWGIYAFIPELLDVIPFAIGYVVLLFKFERKL